MGVLKTRLFILGSGGGEKPMWEAVNRGGSNNNIKYRPNVNLDNHQQGGDAVGEDVLGSPELAYQLFPIIEIFIHLK